MLRYRLIFGSSMIAAFFGIVAFDAWLSQRAIDALGQGLNVVAVEAALPLTLLLVLLMLLAVYELGRLCKLGGYQPVTHWAAFVSAGLVFLPWIEMQQGISPDVVVLLMNLKLHPVLLWLTGGVLGTCLVILARKQTERAVGHMAVTFFIMLYLGLMGSYIVRIRCIWPSADGAWLMLVFVLTVKSGDIGAFFTGRLLGKHKLIPWLSPGKTIEGAVGAIVLACVVAVVAMKVWAGFDANGWAPLNMAQAIVFGGVMAVMGHLGDLVASLIKRDVGSKDSGAVVPAFGGFLDIFDSPVLAAPIAWFLLTSWTPMM